MCVVCAHVSVGRKKRAWWRRVVSTWRGGGGSGNGEGSSSWKKDSLGKKGGDEMERKSMRGRRRAEQEAGGMH